jgi:hypothetical protein
MSGSYHYCVSRHVAASPETVWDIVVVGRGFMCLAANHAAEDRFEDGPGQSDKRFVTIMKLAAAGHHVL